MFNMEGVQKTIVGFKLETVLCLNQSLCKKQQKDQANLGEDEIYSEQTKELS